MPHQPRNLVVVILDSLRYDSWVAAEPAALAQLGSVERRYSYATWTAPSHYNLLMGLLPHTSPREVYASEYYKQDFLRYGDRLGVEGMDFARLLPSMFLPTYLKHSLGYRTHARVSMPVLNEHTIINRDFDSFRLMPKHNDMDAMLAEMRFEADRPSFYLLNVGETHYPYAKPDEDPSSWPRISGVHGVFKHLGQGSRARRCRVLRSPQAARAARPADRSDALCRHRLRATVQSASREYLGHRDLRPWRAVRGGPILRPRAGDAREGPRGPVRRRHGALAPSGLYDAASSQTGDD